MPSIKLSGREQVDRGDEKPDPAREREGMHAERLREREEQREEAEQDRRTDRFARDARRNPRRTRREGEPRERHRDGDREADEGTRHADVEERPPIRNRVPHADERSKSPERREGWQKERQGRLDLVSLRDEVVAHLVAAEDREEWETEEQGPKAD